MYDVNTTDVRIVLTVNGVEIFNELVTDSMMLEAEGYFGVMASKSSVTIGHTGKEIAIDKMLADTQNWVPYSANTETVPVFNQDGSMTVDGTSKTAMGGYSGETFANKLFCFKYSQNLTDDAGWGGIYFNLGNASTVPWSDKGVLICIKKDKVELQVRGNSNNGTVKTYEGQVCASGTTNDVTFGMYDVNTTDVQIVLTVNGMEIFNELVTDSMMLGAEGYFGVMASMSSVTISSGLGEVSGGDAPTYPEVSLSTWIADTENWVTSNTKTEVTFNNDGSMSTGSDGTYTALVGYSGAKYKVNTTLKFEYEHTTDKESVYGGIFLAPTGCGKYVPNQTQNGNSIYLMTHSSKYLRLNVYGGTQTGIYGDVLRKMVSGMTVDGTNVQKCTITFGIYTVEDTGVRIVVTVDGTEVYNEVINDPSYAETDYYFNLFSPQSSNGGMIMTVK